MSPYRHDIKRSSCSSGVGLSISKRSKAGGRRSFDKYDTSFMYRTVAVAATLFVLICHSDSNHTLQCTDISRWLSAAEAERPLLSPIMRDPWRHLRESSVSQDLRLSGYLPRHLIYMHLVIPTNFIAPSSFSALNLSLPLNRCKCATPPRHPTWCGQPSLLPYGS